VGRKFRKKDGVPATGHIEKNILKRAYVNLYEVISLKDTHLVWRASCAGTESM